MARVSLLLMRAQRTTRGSVTVRVAEGDRTLATASTGRLRDTQEWVIQMTSEPFAERATIEVGEQHLEVTAQPTEDLVHVFGTFELRYRISGDLPSEEHPPDLLACGPLHVPSEADDESHPVARESLQTLDVTAPSEEEMRSWPRYVVGRRERVRAEREGDAAEPHQVTVLYIRRPGAEDLQLTPELYRTYLAAVGREPDIADATTWGPAEQIRLSVCHLVDGAPRRLDFDGTHAWTFTLYNAQPLRPAWRLFLFRSLMMLPIQYLRLTRFRSVYLDFFVGTSRLGYTASAVAEGGTNWPRPRSRVRRREEDYLSSADPEACSAVAFAYASFNRCWENQRVITEESIDASVQHIGRHPVTLFHEFGHLWDFTFRQVEDFESRDEFRQDRDYHAVISAEDRMRAPNPARGIEPGFWDRYRSECHYTSGRSIGPAEGFAEAFRKRFQGMALGSSLQTEAERILDEAGLPARDSIAGAWDRVCQALPECPVTS